MSQENPILSAESAADPKQHLDKLPEVKAPPQQQAPPTQPFPGEADTNSMHEYIKNNQPGQPLNSLLSPDGLAGIQDKLQPPELQALQNTNLSQYTGFKADDPSESQTPQSSDFSLLPEQQPDNTQIAANPAQQLEALKQQQLQGVTNFTQEASKNLNAAVIKGTSSVPLYDGTNWDAQQQRINSAFQTMEQSAQQAKDEMAKGMMTNPKQYPQTEDNPNKFRPDSVTNPFRSGGMGGYVKSLWNQFWSKDNTIDVNGNIHKLVNEQNYNDNSEFAPFRGWKLFADAVYKDPWKLVYAPFAPIIASTEGKYGEAGNGVLGGLQYVAGLGMNAVLGGATDLYHLVTGTKDPQHQGSNFVQAFKGGSYDLLRAPDEKHPLSIFPNKDAPNTLAELKQRSILYSNPVSGWAIDRLQDLGVKKFPKPFGNQAADIGLKVTEGAVGLIGDFAADPTGHIIGLLNPKSYARTAEVAAQAAKTGIVAETGAEQVARITKPGEVAKEIQEGAFKMPTPKVPTSEIKKPPMPGLEGLDPNKNPFHVGENGAPGWAEPPKVVGQPAKTKPITQLVQEIPTHPPGTLVNPEGLVVVKRTPNELTALAQHNGHANPSRLQPLPDVRVQMLRGESEELAHTYNTYGAPIPEHELRAVTPPHITVADAPTPETLREIIPEIQKARVTMASPDVSEEVRAQATHTADLLTDKLVTVPNTQNPDVLAELMPTLPESQHVAPGEGAAVLAQKLERETQYHKASTESTELAADLSKQQTALVDHLEQIDEMPDVGRQELHHDPVQEEIPETPEVKAPFDRREAIRKNLRVGTQQEGAIEGARVSMEHALYDLETGDINLEEFHKRLDYVSRDLPADEVRKYKDLASEPVNPLVKPTPKKQPKPPTPQVELQPIRLLDEQVPTTGGLSDMSPEQLNSLKLYHGTRVEGLELSKADPVLGASRSELGTGHYLTTDFNEAKDAGIATVHPNLPPIEGRTFSENTYVHEVSNYVGNLIDAGKSGSAEVNDVFKQAAKGIKEIPAAARKKLYVVIDNPEIPVSKYFTSLDEALAKKGRAFPEEVSLQYQRAVAKKLRRLGYDGIIHTDEEGNTLLSVYNQKKLFSGNVTPIEATASTPLEGAAARYNTIQRTLKRFPTDDVIKVQTREAGATLQSRLVQQTAEHYTEAQQEAVTHAQAVVNAERDLKKLSAQAVEQERALRLAEDVKANDIQSQHMNSPEGWC